MSDDYWRDVVKLPTIVMPYKGVKVYSVNCAQTEVYASFPVGKNNIIGVKINYRDSGEEMLLKRVYLLMVLDIYQGLSTQNFPRVK